MASDGSTSIADVTRETEDKPLMTVRKILTMAGGDGEVSYAKNSGMQQSINSSAYAILSACIRELNLPAVDRGPFVITDMGCSSGPNAIKIVSDVVKMVKKEYHVQGHDGPEIQAYFNDLPSNDFNVLFQQLDSESRQFYYAGVPGSFYGRVFPRNSLNLVLSTNTLHWTSQIPPAITDPNSAAYNKDRVWVHGSNSHVIQAYKQQGHDDMKKFLDARGEELIAGGLLFCIFGCTGEETGDSHEIYLRPFSEDDQHKRVSVMRILEYVWDDLISEGILTEKQRAACNLPMYKFTKGELEEILMSYEDTFQIKVLDEMSYPVPHSLSHEEIDPMMRQMAAILQPLFCTILGKELTSTLFSRLGVRVLHTSKIRGIQSAYLSHLVVLIRK
ncbi:hypothetical protein Mapa_017360 [Marchantia paleacea]|nr:hypothetical protein Mapa_017360 [Marchantia paleacea]